MRVDHMAGHHQMAHGLEKHNGHHDQGRHIGPGPHEPAPEQLQEAVPASGEDGFAHKGVIRNLLNGHYKGVADVRLRMNFGDELARMESSQVAEVMSQPLVGLDDLKSELEALQALAVEEELPEDSPLMLAMDELAAQIEALSQTEGLSVADAKEALEGLKGSLETLLGEIENYLAQVEAETPAEEPPAGELPAGGPPAEKPPAEEPAAEGLAAPEPVEPQELLEPLEDIPAEPVDRTEPTGEESLPLAEEENGLVVALEDFLAKWELNPIETEQGVPASEFVAEEGVMGEQLIEEEPAGESTGSSAGTALMARIDDLLAQLDGIRVMPPLSGPPHNHGGAYAKFLALYLGQTAGPGPESTAYIPETSEGVDTVA